MLEYVYYTLNKHVVGADRIDKGSMIYNIYEVFKIV